MESHRNSQLCKKRLVIFAHYSALMKIDDYVVHFLMGLSRVSNTIIFVSDGNLELVQFNKLKGIVHYVKAEKHGEYDFGSYKRGFQLAEEKGLLVSHDSLVFVNDSCYAPLYEFDEMFSKIEAESCDFWGFTENYFRHKIPRPHLQSFFLVFYAQVFLSEEFRNFLNSVVRQKSKLEVIEKYEIGLTEALVAVGYRYVSYIPRDTGTSNLMLKKWQSLIVNHRSPFLKRSLFRQRYRGWRSPASLWLKYIVRKYTSFPTQLL